jgi:hypothetical protein
VGQDVGSPVGDGREASESHRPGNRRANRSWRGHDLRRSPVGWLFPSRYVGEPPTPRIGSPAHHARRVGGASGTNRAGSLSGARHSSVHAGFSCRSTDHSPLVWARRRSAATSVGCISSRSHPPSPRLASLPEPLPPQGGKDRKTLSPSSAAITEKPPRQSTDHSPLVGESTERSDVGGGCTDLITPSPRPSPHRGTGSKP